MRKNQLVFRRIHGDEMQRLNGFGFYELGMSLQPLERLEDSSLYKDVFYQLHSARTSINTLLNNLPVKVCRTAAQELIDSITDVVPLEWKDAVAHESETTLGYKSYWIRKHKEEFEHVLSAELNSLDTYMITQQGIYNTADLVDRAEMAFSKRVSSSISKEAKDDFQQGGRCLAFDLPTASGFHTMRATEAVLREYHALAVGPKTGRPPEMAQCINELRKANEDPKILNILDSIRDLHRNPQMHPEVFLSMEEALRLFDISKSAINAMADRIIELKDKTLREAASAAPSLTGLKSPALPESSS